MNQMWPTQPLNCAIVYKYRSDPSVAGCSDIMAPLMTFSRERNCEQSSFLNLVLLTPKEGDRFCCFGATNQQQKAP